MSSKTRIMIDEETGERFRASPTAHGWYLTPLKNRSHVVARLAECRNENMRLKSKIEEIDI